MQIRTLVIILFQPPGNYYYYYYYYYLLLTFSTWPACWPAAGRCAHPLPSAAASCPRWTLCCWRCPPWPWPGARAAARGGRRTLRHAARRPARRRTWWTAAGWTGGTPWPWRRPSCVPASAGPVPTAVCRSPRAPCTTTWRSSRWTCADDDDGGGGVHGRGRHCRRTKAAVIGRPGVGGGCRKGRRKHVCNTPRRIAFIKRTKIGKKTRTSIRGGVWKSSGAGEAISKL